MAKNKKDIAGKPLFGAIDIGSNAIRGWVGYVTKVHSGYRVNKVAKKRIALRLGKEVLETGYISKESAGFLAEAIELLGAMFRNYGVSRYLACATETFRIATNSKEVLKTTEDKTRIHISVISGTDEAGIIFAEQISHLSDDSRHSVFVDLGGGSADFVIKKFGFKEVFRSFRIGTLRIQMDKVPNREWQDIRTFLEDHISDPGGWQLFGSGGNIRALHKLSNKRKGEPLSIDELNHFLNKMIPLTIAERMEKWQIRADRADVIVPALEVFLFVLHTTGINEIHVPKTNLCKGLILLMFKEKNGNYFDY